MLSEFTLYQNCQMRDHYGSWCRCRFSLILIGRNKVINEMKLQMPLNVKAFFEDSFTKGLWRKAVQNHVYLKRQRKKKSQRVRRLKRGYSFHNTVSCQSGFWITVPAILQELPQCSSLRTINIQSTHYRHHRCKWYHKAPMQEYLW